MLSDSESSDSKHFHYEEQLKIIKEYNQEALEAFQEAFDVKAEDVTYEEFANSYQGEFDSSNDFAKYCVEMIGELKIPSWVIVDYESTWKYNLSNDYTEQDFHFFRN